MRMLLTSNGIQNEVIRNALLDLLGKPTAESRVVAIIDAMLPFPGDKSGMLRHLEQLRSLGWDQFDVMSLFAGPRSLIKSRLRGADVIFCYGGSNHWLAHAWTSTGFAPLLRELIEEKVYLGLSAGSMIFSTAHAAAVEAFDDREEVELFELDSVTPALPFFGWYVAPHLGASFMPHQTDEWATDAAARLGAPVWFIDDDTALVIRDSAAEPEVISTGHWLHFDASGQLIGSR
jgi:dipeptidase E